MEDSGGLTLGLWLKLPQAVQPGKVLADTRNAEGCGLAVLTSGNETVQIRLSGSGENTTWRCDAGTIEPGKLKHVVVIVDAGPQIISFVVDGMFCDGGEKRQFGWGRYQGPIGDLGGAGKITIAPEVKKLRLYNRYLRTSEAVANYHAGI